MEKRAQGGQQEKLSWDVDSREEYKIRILKEAPKETWMNLLWRSPSQHVTQVLPNRGQLHKTKKHLDSFLCADSHYLLALGPSEESG